MVEYCALDLRRALLCMQLWLPRRPLADVLDTSATLGPHCTAEDELDGALMHSFPARDMGFGSWLFNSHTSGPCSNLVQALCLAGSEPNDPLSPAQLDCFGGMFAHAASMCLHANKLTCLSPASARSPAVESIHCMVSDDALTCPPAPELLHDHFPRVLLTHAASRLDTLKQSRPGPTEAACGTAVLLAVLRGQLQVADLQSDLDLILTPSRHPCREQRTSMCTVSLVKSESVLLTSSCSMQYGENGTSRRVTMCLLIDFRPSDAM